MRSSYHLFTSQALTTVYTSPCLWSSLNHLHVLLDKWDRLRPCPVSFTSWLGITYQVTRPSSTAAAPIPLLLSCFAGLPNALLKIIDTFSQEWGYKTWQNFPTRHCERVQRGYSNNWERCEKSDLCRKVMRIGLQWKGGELKHTERDVLNILNQQGRRKKRIENVRQTYSGFLQPWWWSRCKCMLGSILNPGDPAETSSWKRLYAWGCFLISLGLQMWGYELFRTSVTTLIILEAFHISLSAWILLVPQLKNVLVSPRTTQPAYPSSILGATLRLDGFNHTTKGTAAVGTHFLLCKWCWWHKWDWRWH